MISDFLNMVFSTIFDLLNPLFDIFPAMPVEWSQVINGFFSIQLVDTVLNWVNWLLPFDVASAIISAWVLGMLTYIGIKVAFGTAKVVF